MRFRLPHTRSINQIHIHLIAYNNALHDSVFVCAQCVNCSAQVPVTESTGGESIILYRMTDITSFRLRRKNYWNYHSSFFSAVKQIKYRALSYSWTRTVYRELSRDIYHSRTFEPSLSPVNENVWWSELSIENVHFHFKENTMYKYPAC